MVGIKMTAREAEILAAIAEHGLNGDADHWDQTVHDIGDYLVRKIRQAAQRGDDA